MKDKKNRESMDELKKQCQEYLNGWKRAKADLVNYKKEVEKNQSDFRDFVAADILLELLPIHDHFKKALTHVPKKENQEWLTGITHIKSQLDKFLQDRGVSEIKTQGEKLNPELHEAIGQRQDKKAEPGVIIEECSTGYVLNGKVIMPAKVIVAE
ncbi:nucleotide exchange factor GrpE [Candidatus Falkowbacteria bacterium]|nr:nucleotide exchange factor GrpE [Candidatus Falkowbacteria bacterium]